MSFYKFCCLIKLEIFYWGGGSKELSKKLFIFYFLFFTCLERFVQQHARLCDFTACCLGHGRFSENLDSIQEEAVQEHWEQG